MKILVTLITLFTVVSANAQLLFTLTTTTGTYTEINGVSINQGLSWTNVNTYPLPLGFNFDLFSGEYSEASMWPSYGTIFLGVHPNFEGLISPFFVDIKDKGDSISQSPLSYELTGTAGNHVLKVQWKNAGFAADTLEEDFVNFQVWIHESTNQISIHIGPNSVKPGSYDFGGPVIGLGDVFADRSFALSGDPANPVLIEVNDGDTVALMGTPANGTIYTFTPVNTGIRKSLRNTLNFYPNPANEFIVIQDVVKRSLVSIFNSTGQLQLQTTITPEVNYININSLNEGLFIIKVEDGTGIKTKTLLKK
jgi:hypothetical protein